MGVITQCWCPGSSHLLKAILWLSPSYSNLQDFALLLIVRELPRSRFTIRGPCGPLCCWGLPHVHQGFQPSSAYPNPAEGCALMNNICIAWMGM